MPISNERQQPERTACKGVEGWHTAGYVTGSAWDELSGQHRQLTAGCVAATGIVTAAQGLGLAKYMVLTKAVYAAAFGHASSVIAKKKKKKK